jgi:hypothetical protein
MEVLLESNHNVVVLAVGAEQGFLVGSPCQVDVAKVDDGFIFFSHFAFVQYVFGKKR